MAASVQKTARGQFAGSRPPSVTPYFSSPRQFLHPVKRRSAEEAVRIKSPFDAGSHITDDVSNPRSTEAFVDVQSLLSEVTALSESYLFEDEDEDEEVWEHEARLTPSTPPTTSAQGSTSSPQTVFAKPLDPEAVDILSAYSVEQGFHQLTPAQLRPWLGGGAGGRPGLLLDVRTRHEFAAGHLPGSVNFPMEELSAAVRAGLLDQYRSQPVAVVCAAGTRSAQATVRLTKVFRFQDVANVAGGIAACRAEGLPVVKE